MAYEDAYYKRMKDLGWDDLINSANMQGNDALREQYIKYRNAGISKMDVQSRGGIDLGNGFTYDSLYGKISGQDYSYDPNKNINNQYHGSTKYGDFTYNGLYDFNVLNSITDDDWNSARDKYKGDFEGRQGSLDNYLESVYTKDLNKFGGQYNDSITLGGDKYQDMYDTRYNELDTQYMNNVMKTAYETALGRYSGDLVSNQIFGGDYTEAYKKPTSQYLNLDAIMNNTGMSESVKQHYLQQAKAAGQDISQYDKAPVEEYATALAYDRNNPATWPENQPQKSTNTAPVYPTATPSTSTEYAEAMLPGTPQSTQQENLMSGEITQPWSEDFEKQFIEQMQGYGNTLSNYLGSSQSTTPKFSLQGYQSSVAMNNNTPILGSNTQQTGLAPSQSSTGKAGNKQALWS